LQQQLAATAAEATVPQAQGGGDDWF
jgi:hypothetical protein